MGIDISINIIKNENIWPYSFHVIFNEIANFFSPSCYFKLVINIPMNYFVSNFGQISITVFVHVCVFKKKKTSLWR